MSIRFVNMYRIYVAENAYEVYYTAVCDLYMIQE